MPLRNEHPSLVLSGNTATVSITAANGVMVNVTLPAPRGSGRMDEDELEHEVYREASVALRSALDRLH